MLLSLTKKCLRNNRHAGKKINNNRCLRYEDRTAFSAITHLCMYVNFSGRTKIIQSLPPSKLYVCVFLLFSAKQLSILTLPLQVSGKGVMRSFNLIGPVSLIWRQISQVNRISQISQFFTILKSHTPLVYIARDVTWYGGMLNVIQIVFAPAAHILKLERYRED